MAQLLLLRGARQVLTLQGPSGVRRGAALHDLCVIEDGSVLIRDGLIASVGSTRRIDNLKEAKSAPEISVENMIIMPGFVDPGIRIDLFSCGARQRRRMCDFRSETASLLRSCLQHGTLNVQLRIRGGAGELRSQLSALRQVSVVAEPAGFVDRSWQIDPAITLAPGALHTLDAYLRRISARNLAQSIELTPAGNQAIATAIQEAAGIAKLPVAFNWEGGPIGYLARALQEGRPRAVFSDCNISSMERELLARSSQVVVFSPESTLFGEESLESVKEWVDEGAGVALSTGYDASSNPTFSMQTILSLAVLRLQLSAEEAISACTINAAHALGRGHLTGSIEYGKRADLLVMNVPSYAELPRRLGVNNVAMAIRGGNVVFNRTRWKPRDKGAAA